VKIHFNVKSFLVTSLIVFLVIWFMDFLIHHVALVSLYQDSAEVWRAPAAMIMWPMYLSQLSFAFIFVYLFTRNYQAKGMAEGARFGLYIGLLLAAINIGVYSYLPVPLTLILAWIIAGLLKSMILGVTTACIYRE